MALNLDRKGTPGSDDRETVGKARDVRMKGKELKVLTPAYIQTLVGLKLSFADLRGKIENEAEFAGYTLPSQADIDFLKIEGEDKRENMGKLVEDFPGNEVTMLAWEGDEPTRTRYVRTESSFDEQPLHSEQKDYKHLRPEDCIFLIKNTTN